MTAYRHALLFTGVLHPCCNCVKRATPLPLYSILISFLFGTSNLPGLCCPSSHLVFSSLQTVTWVGIHTLRSLLQKDLTLLFLISS